ncbi:S-adenosyl-L-methionine-dependent methyltransferase, partial [Mycena filopes]
MDTINRDVYAFTHASESGPEMRRLDDLNAAFTQYAGGRLSMAPIAGNPQKIIDLGCGRGAWAIQAALEFPEAQVVATDMSPLPPRLSETPENIHFVLADLTKEWEFELGTFDIVHARLVLIHVPNPEQVIARVLHSLRR